LEQVLEEDKRPSVLYLRPFDREEEPFAAPLNEECRQLGVPVRHPSRWRQAVTFEEYFAKEVTEKIGPFIALGNPYDYLPPAGAARTYIEDDGWQDVFRTMSHESACILMAPGRSDNLRWELRSIRSMGLHTKLFVLTSPAIKQHWYSIQWGRSGKRQWDDFTTELAASGFVASEYPGDGATVGFDEGGTAVMQGTGARTPAEYVSIIGQELEKLLPKATSVSANNASFA
jgi:hypothetical protein